MMLMTWLMLVMAQPAEEITAPTEWKVQTAGGRGGRILFTKDPIFLMIANDPEYTPDWEETATVDEEGRVSHRSLRNGWAYAEVRADTDTTLLASSRSAHSLFVNGERFVGDYYGKNYGPVPIPLRRGVNRLFVRCMRRGFSLQFAPAPGTASIGPRDALFPDLRADALIDAPGTVVVLNHTGDRLKDARLEVGDGDLFEKAEVLLDPMLPYGLRKPVLPLKQLRQPRADELDADGRYHLSVRLNAGETTQTADYALPIRSAGEQYTLTRISGIDGSVQYAAVKPPTDPDRESYALYLSLHGASVEATGQAAAYAPKPDGYLIAPTNRRPYGFDWQEWGRIDALEVLDDALERYPIDRSRVYLTGHSMGGHGTWYLGATYPDRFAAIAPSAGWISFFSYGGLRRQEAEPESTPLLDTFKAAQLESNTLALLQNYASLPIYILHGEKDDNVPVTQSRQMADELAAFHRDFVYHEQPGAGHWWGSDCVDWVPLFEFLRHHRRVESPLNFSFSTPNPAISANYGWATIVQQQDPSSVARIEVSTDPRRGKATLSTENVSRLELRLAGVFRQEEATLRIDDTELTLPTEVVHLGRKADGIWEQRPPLDSSQKGAHRNGPFKLAFDRQMVWVYGTAGTDEETEALIAKVRYDAQVWWYRGNGDVQVIPDAEFTPEAFPDSNVILYGNRDNNRAFELLLADCPIQVERKGISVGSKIHVGDFCTLFVYPRPGTERQLVGVVGATTVRAIRWQQQARYFVSGVASPDYVLFDQKALTEGLPGVLAAGYFTSDWRLPSP